MVAVAMGAVGEDKVTAVVMAVVAEEAVAGAEELQLKVQALKSRARKLLIFQQSGTSVMEI